MNRIRTILASMWHRITAAANDSIAIANAHGQSEAIFEVQQDGSFFIPYGKYAHGKGLQIFDRSAAEEMHEAANSMLTRAAGIPIYPGHPDVPGRPDSNPSAPAYGWITDIEVLDDGIRTKNKLNKRGIEAIENAEFRFYSPYWLLKKVPGGISPVRLLSVGLTNKPLIPVPAISNDSESPTQKNYNPMTKEQLTAIGLPEDATEEQIAARLDELKKAESELADLRSRADKAESDLAEANDTLATATGDLTAANDRATRMREILIDSALERAVLGGRITEADRDTRRTELLAIENDADLTAGLGALDTAQASLPGGQTGDLTGARAVAAAENSATARASERQRLVNEEITAIANDANFNRLTPAGRYDLGWHRAQKKRPDLFTAQANA